MQIGKTQAAKYWRLSYQIEALRLTEDNLQDVAEFIGGEYTKEFGDEWYVRHVDVGEGYAGEWLVQHGEMFRFYTDEEFLNRFKTNDEHIHTDRRYAKIFQLVAGAMAKQDRATFSGDQTGMDLLMIETVKRIVGEL